MIDLDKFICDFLSFKLSKEQKNQIPFRGSYYQANAALKYIRFSIDYALKQQGLEYKEGVIVPIESKPKFKIGQAIVYKGTENIAPTKMIISDIVEGQYWDDNCCIVPISDQDNWESEKSSTIKFDKPDIEEMVEDFKRGIVLSHNLKNEDLYIRTIAYRKGLEDMWNELKSK